MRTVRRWLEQVESPSAVIKSAYCSFLNISDVNDNQWMWDGEGCQVESTGRNQTVCLCNHLTSFADLMDFHDYVVRFFLNGI